jgi:hypothetical protein
MLFTGLREGDVEKISKILTENGIPHKTGVDPSFMEDPGSVKGRSSTKINHEHFMLDVEIHDLEKLPDNVKSKLPQYGLYYQAEDPDFSDEPTHHADGTPKPPKAPKKENKFVQYIMGALAIIWIMMVIKNNVDI